MPEHLLVRVVSDQPKLVEWIISDAKGENREGVFTGTLDEFALLTKQRRVILIICGSDLLLRQVNLPATSRRNILKALPYAMEEHLIEDAGQYYFSHIHQADGSGIPVAAIERQYLELQLQKFSNAGVTLCRALPEPLILPWDEECWSLLCESERIILRYGEYNGFAIERQAFDTVISQLLQAYPESEKPKISLWSQTDEPELTLGLQSLGCTIEVIRSVTPDLLSIAEVSQTKPELELLHSIRRESGIKAVSVQAWWPTLALIFCALTLQVGLMGFHYWSLKQEKISLNHDLNLLFTRSFPEVKRVVNPLVQAERLLEQRENSVYQHGDPFLSLFYQVGSALNRDKGVKLKGLEYLNGPLQLLLMGEGIPQIEAFKQRLEQSGTLQVEVRSAVTQQQGVESSVRVERK